MLSRRLFSSLTKPFPSHPLTPAFSSVLSNTPQNHTPLKFTSSFESLLPAFTTFFLTNSSKLNIPHLLSSPQDLLLPIEFTDPKTGVTSQSQLPWSAFLGYLCAPQIKGSLGPRLYLAQHEIPSFLEPDLPAPLRQLGLKTRSKSNTTPKTTPAGDISGDVYREIDIYATSLWLSPSHSPTNTPLHRDPNDNLFIQLSLSKVIRCISPETGDVLFKNLHKLGLMASTDPRGRIRDGLFDPQEKRILDQIIWEEDGKEESKVIGELRKWIFEQEGVYESTVDRGEGVYIPRGWWHAVRSLIPDKPEENDGVVGSVNWWFR